MTPPGTQAPTPQFPAGRKSPLSPRVETLLCRAVASALVAGFAPATLHALPTDGQVTAGQAQIGAPVNGALTIQQTSQRAAINWQSFGIGAGESVRFNQPSASSIVLNRVLGTDPSNIYGSLSANGQVFLLNPNGVLFAPGAQVNVGGIVASTLQLSDTDFMAGRYTFTRGASAGSIINQGTITAANGGYVALLGPQVKNEGVITASLGTVALAAGSQVTLNLNGNSLVSLTVDKGAVDALVENRQLIRADGGQVVMTAKAADALIRSVVNNEGIVEGNRIVVEGDRIRLAAGSRLDASADPAGSAPGGEILVGGGYRGKDAAIRNAETVTVEAGATLAANGAGSAAGGTIVVWSDGTTRYSGDISAKGGSAGAAGGTVEVSGKQALEFRGSVDTGGGTLLLDPATITVQSTNGDQTNTFGVGQLNTLLGANDVTLDATGDITWNGSATLSYTNSVDRSLNLQAGNSIIFNSGAAITPGTGAVKLSIMLNANHDASGAGNIQLTNTTINSNGGAITLGGGANALTTAAIGTGTGTAQERAGIYLSGSTLNAGAGATSLRGQGVASTSSAPGIQLLSGSVVGSATGAGAITLNGTGGVGTDSNYGVYLTGSNTAVRSADGNISITGQGAGTGGSNYGVFLENGAAVRSTGTGAISLTATGAAGAADFTAAGTASTVTSTTGDITINANSVDWGAGLLTLQSSGDLLIQPRTAATTIGIGDGATGTLNLTSAELNGIQDGFASITIGKADGRGAVDVRSYTFKDDLLIRTPVTTGNITLNGALATGSGSQLGSITLQAGNSIIGNTGASVTTQGRDIVLNSDRDGAGQGNIQLTGTTITSNGGAIALGGGPNPFLNVNYGVGVGTEQVESGIYLADSTLDAGAGALSMRGVGTLGGAVGYGILASGSVLGSATGTGTITLYGGASRYGVHLRSATVKSAYGDISITGEGTFGADHESKGVTISNGGLVQSTGTGANAARITIQGTGGSSPDTNVGVRIVGGATAAVKSVDGDISITGQGGQGGTSAFDNFGIHLSDFSLVQSSGTARITLNGTGGSGSTSRGVYLSGSAAAVKSVNGDISITGLGGGAASNTNNTGIFFENGLVESTGTGPNAARITLSGTGGAGSAATDGILLTGGTLRGIKSIDGDISITGQGGGTSASGINQAGSDVRSTGMGQITLTGTAAGTAADIRASGASSVVASTGDITVNANSVDWGAGLLTLQSSGHLLIQPRTAATTIGIGSGATGSLNLTNAELGGIQDGFASITIGKVDGSGAIDVRSPTFRDDLLIRAPAGNADITLNGALATGSGSQAGGVTLQAGGSVVGNSGASVTTQARDIVLNADRDASGEGSINLTNTTITSGGGAITLGGGANPLTTAAFGTTAQPAGILLSGSTLVAGAGAISLRGEGRSSTVGYGIALASGSAVGSATSTGAITLTGTGGGTAADINATGASTVASATGDITINANSVDWGAGLLTLQSGGHLLIQPRTAATTIGIGDGASGTLNLTSAALGGIQDGFASITIGKADGSGAIDVRSLTFRDDLLIRTPAGAGNVTLNGALATGSGSQLGSITLQAGNSIIGSTGASVITQARDIVLNADGDTSGAGNVQLTNTAINSNGGAITLGGGADPLTTAAIGIGAGSAQQRAGIYLSGSTLDAGAGAISLRGQGVAGTSSTHGIDLLSGSVVGGAAATGAITLYGTTGAGTNNSYGVHLSGSNTAVKSAEGAISITGQGVGTGFSNIGIRIESGATVESTGTGANVATVTLDGTGSAGTNLNSGVNLIAATVKSAEGDILIIGRGAGNGGSNYGIRISSGAVVQSTGTGANAATVTLDGTGGTGNADIFGVSLDGTNTAVKSVDGAVLIIGQGGLGTGSRNSGIRLESGAAVQSTGTGANAATITLQGTGGAGGDSNHGVYLLGNNTAVRSAAGRISITGQGGTGSGPSNYGIRLESGAMVQSTGTGANAATVTLDGTGGTGTSSFNRGVSLSDSNTAVTSIDGAISITGQGGTSSTRSQGISMESGAVVQSTGTGTNSATVTLQGTAGSGAGFNYGVLITGDGTAVRSVAGDISITGQGAGSGLGNVGIRVDTGAIVESTGTGANAAAIALNGTGGTGTTINHGVYLLGGNAAVRSAEGAISITGQGGAGSGSDNYGIFLDLGAGLESTGTGANAATVTLKGTGGAGTGSNYGVHIAGTNTAVTSAAGEIAIAAAAGGGTNALDFVNASGNSAVASTSGRWLIYTSVPANNTYGGLASGQMALYGRTFASNPPAGITETGKRYIFAAAPGTLTVTSSNAGKNYGDAYDLSAPIAGTHYALTGFLNAATFGGVWTQDTAANIGFGGAPTLTSPGAVATAGAGNYAINLALGTLTNSGGYTMAGASTGTLTVNKRPVTVTADSGQSKVYGNADPVAYTFTSTSLGAGVALSGVLTRAAGENVANSPYAITQDTLTNANNPNYSLSYAGNSFAITQRPITVSAGAGQSKVYGNADPALTYSVSSGNLVGGDTLAGSLARTAGENVGNGYGINQGSLANTNYAITWVGDNFAITRRPVSVTAVSQSKIYGDADPYLAYTVGGMGLAPGETSPTAFSGQLTRAAGENVTGGPYSITQGTLAPNANYDLTAFTGGQLTVAPRPVSVAVNNVMRLQGQPNPAFSVAYSGFAAGDGISSLGGALLVTTPADATSPAGLYPILPSGNVSSNYAISYVNGVLTIGFASLDGAAQDAIAAARKAETPSMQPSGNSGQLVNIVGPGIALPEGVAP